MTIQTSYLINKSLIEPAFNRVTIDGQIQSIEPRVMDVLIMLIENTGSPVSREALVQKVWKGRAVSDSSLNRNIAILRKLLDKEPGQSSCIRTIPKRGYLLEAEVVSATSDQEPILNYSNQNKEIPQKQFGVAPKPHFLPKSTLARLTLTVLLAVTLSLLLQFLLFQYDFLSSSAQPSAVRKTDNISAIRSNESVEVAHTTTFSPQDSGKAFCLDGVDDYVEINDQSVFDIGLGDFSVSAWVKTESQKMVTIVDKRDEEIDGSVRGFSLYLSQGLLGFQLADGIKNWDCSPGHRKSACANYNTTAFVADNEWHFITITLDRDVESGLRFYVNGEFIRHNNPTTRRGSLSANNPIRIGSRSSSVSSLFPGHIGEIKLYNRVLTLSEISLHYQIGVSRNCPSATNS